MAQRSQTRYCIITTMKTIILTILNPLSCVALMVFSMQFQAIIGALGGVRRNNVLAGLYMGRSDTQLVVRQASLHVWKIVVSNTPRTLREILPTLFSLLLGFLASTCPDKRTVRLPAVTPVYELTTNGGQNIALQESPPATVRVRTLALIWYSEERSSDFCCVFSLVF